MSTAMNRRGFVKTAGALAAGAAFGGAARAAAPKYEFDISLAGWSLHRAIGNKEGMKNCLEMPGIAKNEFGISAIELVSQMMASDEPAYVAKMGANAEKAGVKILLIMVDGQGDMAAMEDAARDEAVTKHKHWIDIAADLGCHSIRMNWSGAPDDFLTDKEVLSALIKRSAPGYRTLCEYADAKGLNVMIENHWGPSSYPEILVRLIKKVDHPRMGTLPDFGNFPDDVDRYQAVDMMMPYAKAVSAKCYDFDAATGLETKIDYARMLEIVCGKHGYKGHIGIEYEGTRMSEPEGIVAAKKLLDSMRA